MPDVSTKLGVLDFGRELLDARDLDPVYTVLYHSSLEGWDLKKFLLAYWCYYDLGTCCRILEAESYWEAMLEAGGTKEYARGRERRHFRGRNAMASLEYLRGQGLNRLFKSLCVPAQDLPAVLKTVKAWVGFGPWIAFKVADMINALGLSRVAFDETALALFDTPRQGAHMAWELHGLGEEPESVEAWAVEYVTEGLGGAVAASDPFARFPSLPLAPPAYTEPLGAQEAETVLCKWKAYRSGRYHVGEDVEACRRALERAPKGLLRLDLIGAGEEGKLWRPGDVEL